MPAVAAQPLGHLPLEGARSCLLDRLLAGGVLRVGAEAEARQVPNCSELPPASPRPQSDEKTRGKHLKSCSIDTGMIKGAPTLRFPAG